MFGIWKRKEAQESRFRRDQIVPIVANAAVAVGTVGDGRMLPLIILDTTERPDLVDLFNAHDKLPPGDVDTTWALLEEFSGHMALLLEFKRPFETVAIINFELTGDGLSIDLAMQGKAIYLQAGKPGDRLHQTMTAPRIIVEIGAEMSKVEWEVIWQKAIRKRLRTEGASRAEAKRLSPAYMERMRSTVKQFRSMPSGVYVIPDSP